MPIPIEQRFVAIIISLTLLLVIVQLIRKHKLREEHALIWLAASLGIFFFSVFGGFARILASLFAVSYTPTLFLVLGLLFALVVLLSQTVALSTQSNRVRDLAQHIALLEWHVRRLEEDEAEMAGSEAVGGNPSDDGRDQPQPAVEQRLPRRRRQQVVAAHHVGDALAGVVHDDGELVGGDAAPGPDDEVPDLAVGMVLHGAGS